MPKMAQRFPRERMTPQNGPFGRSLFSPITLNGTCVRLHCVLQLVSPRTRSVSVCHRNTSRQQTTGHRLQSTFRRRCPNECLSFRNSSRFLFKCTLSYPSKNFMRRVQNQVEENKHQNMIMILISLFHHHNYQLITFVFDVLTSQPPHYWLWCSAQSATAPKIMLHTPPGAIITFGEHKNTKYNHQLS